jgi:pyruvate dehydrogenase E2 component (dihydrolipoamide acetyltransferase)
MSGRPPPSALRGNSPPPRTPRRPPRGQANAAIINHLEVAILGMGRVIDRPWVVDGQLTVQRIAELTLAFDHRACDDGTAGGFLR